ncbi:MAG TPA: DNA polymerase/3'-5' exonuclease PolX [Gammaproteobacteria bacterium]|nr:DNA polymerase/3'-5' exonuclease PolX [Gammaproteobacteria bacterium]
MTNNEEIAHAFDEIADLLEIEEANPFRVRAYRHAARTLRGLGREVGELAARGDDLTRLPGIGKDLAAKIEEMLESGKIKALDKLHKIVPMGVEALLQIPGLGPKRVKRLYHLLGIESVKQLEQAVSDGRVRELPGFGAGIERNILAALKAHRETEKRFPRAQVRSTAEAIETYLKQASGVKEVVVAGSYRRGRETVGDLDILVTTSGRTAAMEHFVGYEEVDEVISSGTTRATVILRSGLQVDLRVVAQQSYGAALYYFTGSKSHNIQVRRLAQQRGLKINEYGVFRGKRRIAGKTESSIFKSVGLPYIPPELREGRGEIEAAYEKRLPILVERADLKGDLHCHTTATDGHAGIREMALAARRHGLNYLAITDHSRRLAMVHGLDSSRLLKQADEIDRLNDELKGITLLKGIEVDILADGRLDLPDKVLRRLDLVVGAVHSQFHLPRDKQTERILRAMERPCFTLLAHPTGRLLQQREAYDIDMARIIKQAGARGCFMELNSQPLRLDLDEFHCRMAHDEGVMVSINSDAHAKQHFDYLQYGIDQARRGWLEKRDVLNALPLRELRALLRRTMI